MTGGSEKGAKQILSYEVIFMKSKVGKGEQVQERVAMSDMLFVHTRGWNLERTIMEHPGVAQAAAFCSVCDCV